MFSTASNLPINANFKKKIVFIIEISKKLNKIKIPNAAEVAVCQSAASYHILIGSSL